MCNAPSIPSISDISNELARVDKNIMRPIIQAVANPLFIAASAVLGPVAALIATASNQDQQQGAIVDQAVQDNTAQVTAVDETLSQTDQALADAQSASDEADTAAQQAYNDALVAQQEAQASGTLDTGSSAMPSGPSLPSGPSASGSTTSFSPTSEEFYSPMEMAQAETPMPQVASQLTYVGNDQNGNPLFQDQSGNFYDQYGDPVTVEAPQAQAPRYIQYEHSVPRAPEGEVIEMPTMDLGPEQPSMDTTPQISEEFTQDTGASPFDREEGSFERGSYSWDRPFGFANAIKKVQRMGEAETKNVDEVAGDFTVKNLVLTPTLEEPERIMIYKDIPIDTEYKGPLLPTRKMITRSNMIVKANKFLPLPDSTLPEYGEIETPGYVPTRVGFANDLIQSTREPIGKDISQRKPVNGSEVKKQGDTSVKKARNFFKGLEEEFKALNKQFEFAQEHKLRIRGLDKGKELNPILRKLNQLDNSLAKLGTDIKSKKLFPTMEYDAQIFNYLVDQAPELAKSVGELRGEILRELGAK